MCTLIFPGFPGRVGTLVKGSPEDKQPSDPCIKGSAKISRRVTMALYTGETFTT